MSETKYYFVSYTQNVNGRNYFYNIGVIDNPLGWLVYKNNSSPNNPCTILFFKEIPYRDYLLLAKDFSNLSDEEQIRNYINGRQDKETRMKEIQELKDKYVDKSDIVRVYKNNKRLKEIYAEDHPKKENPELEAKIKSFKLWRKRREDKSSEKDLSGQ